MGFWWPLCMPMTWAKPVASPISASSLVALPGHPAGRLGAAAHGRLWQFAHPGPLSLLQRGLAPRSKGKARAELRPARRQARLPHSRSLLLPGRERAPPRHAHGDLTSLAPHERLPEILVVPREKTPTGAAARGARRGTGVPGERVRSSRSAHGAPRLSFPPARRGG